MRNSGIVLSRAASLLVCVCGGNVAYAQDSAVSSHYNFNDTANGDIIVNEVRVPSGGLAMYTYYETLGWWGVGSGYSGIQEHPYGRVFIFSIWDNPAHQAPIEEVYAGFGTVTEPFGGEGTGLKSMNYDVGWVPDTWYAFVARAWPVGDHTYYAYWVRDGQDGTWRHLVTMDVAAQGAVFEGGNDSFIEDWSSTGSNRRETNLRRGWKRRTSDSQWIAVTSGVYSINSWDIEPGGRSYNYRTNWDGGKKSDSTGEYYYMVSGGVETSPTCESGTTFGISQSGTEPDFTPGELDSLDAELASSTLNVSWTLDTETLPQFGYLLEIFDNSDLSGSPIVAQGEDVPHKRDAQIDISSLDTENSAYYLAAYIIDVFDQKSEPMIKGFGTDVDVDVDVDSDSDSDADSDSDSDADADSDSDADTDDSGDDSGDDDDDNDDDNDDDGDDDDDNNNDNSDDEPDDAEQTSDQDGCGCRASGRMTGPKVIAGVLRLFS